MKLKLLLKKSIRTAASALLLVSSLLPAGNIIAATQAPVGVQQLQPASYDTYDTGNHSYTNGEFNHNTNYTTGSTDGHTVPTSDNWFNLVNATASTVGYAVFNGSIATNQTFTMSAVIKMDDSGFLGSGNWHNTGDALGFILTPSSASQLATNVQSATGPNLGISGLVNTYFIGRDLYSNLSTKDASGNVVAFTGIDGTPANSWTDGGGSVIAIRCTDGSGTLQAANYPTISSNAASVQNTSNGTAYTDAPDDNYTLGIDTGTPAIAQENVTMNWTPDATNTAPTGFNSGTLSFTLVPQTSNNGTKTITTHTNLQSSMSFGFLGGTGGNYGNLSVSLNGASGTMGRGTSAVTVNYLNSVTNQPISGMPASTITANVDDTLSATNSTSSSTANGALTTYNFQAPTAPAGYTYSSSNSITVQNYQSGTSNPNIINILYTPTAESCTLYQAFEPGTPGTTTVDSSQVTDFSGANFPATIAWAGSLNSGMTGTTVAGMLQSTVATGQPTALSGNLDTAITYPDLAMSSGYTIGHIYYRNNDGSWQVYTADGTTDLYAELKADHPNFELTYNTIVVTYQATTQTPDLKVHFATPDANGNTPSDFTVNFQKADGSGDWSGLTGSLIPDDVVSQTLSQTAAEFTSKNLGTGWTLSQYSDPDGNGAASLSDAVAAVGGVILGSSKASPTNEYTADYDYVGSISMVVPGSIDFGNHQITGNTQYLTGAMEDAVTVTDNRAAANKTGWSVTVQEDSPLMDATGTLSFEGMLQYDGQVLSSSPLTVLSTSVADDVTAPVTVLSSDSNKFQLIAPPNLQVPSAGYTGSVVWTLLQTP